MYSRSTGTWALLRLEVQLYNFRRCGTSLTLESSLAYHQLVSRTVCGAFTMDRRTNGKERSSCNSEHFADKITVPTDICRQPGPAGFGQRENAFLYKHNP